MVRYSLLVVYIVYMLLKNMKQLFNQAMLDPRLSYKKQMTLVYEQPKAFLEGCIGISGSVVTIHQPEPIPQGPILYVHPRLRLAELALIAGYIEEWLALSPTQKCSACLLSGNGWIGWM